MKSGGLLNAEGKQVVSSLRGLVTLVTSSHAAGSTRLSNIVKIQVIFPFRLTTTLLQREQTPADIGRRRWNLAPR